MLKTTIVSGKYMGSYTASTQASMTNVMSNIIEELNVNTLDEAIMALKRNGVIIYVENVADPVVEEYVLPVEDKVEEIKQTLMERVRNALNLNI